MKERKETERNREETKGFRFWKRGDFEMRYRRCAQFISRKLFLHGLLIKGPCTNIFLHGLLIKSPCRNGKELDGR